MSTILELTKEQQRLKDQLFFEDDESSAALLTQMLSQISGTIEHKLQFMIDLQFELELESDAKREAARVTQKRAITAENKAAKLKEFIFEVMSEQGLKRVDGVYRGFSRCQRDSLVINLSTEFLPDEYLRRKAPEPDKIKITEDLKAGVEIIGCTLVKTDYLRAV